MNFKKIISLMLVFAMCLSMIPTYAFADDEGGDDLGQCGHYNMYEVTTATCTEPGETYLYCPDCYEQFDFNYVDALGHDYRAFVTEPTCTEGGYTTYTCNRCDDSYVGDQTDAIGHDYAAVVTDPTCAAGGYTTYTCSRCGDSYTADETAALGHKWGEWETVTEATAEAAGSEKRVCQTCGAEETREVEYVAPEEPTVILTYVPAVEPTCGADGSIEYWLNKETGEYFADENGEKALTSEDLVDPATGKHEFEDGVCIVCGEKDPDYEAPVATVGEEEFTDFAKAAAYASNNDTVVLLANVDKPYVLEEGATLYVQKNGFNLSVVGGESDVITEETIPRRGPEITAFTSSPAVAQIGETPYATLAAAIAAANQTGDCTITILTDIDFSDPAYAEYKWAGSTYNPLTITANDVTIDLNGHTFSNMGNTALVFGHIHAADSRISNGAIINGSLLAGQTDGVTNSYVLGVAGVDGMQIKNVTTNGGINVYTGSTDVVIEDCTVNGTKYYTVCAQCGSDVTIKGTTYTKNTDASVANKSMFWVDKAGSDSDCATGSNPTGAYVASSITIASGSFTVDTTNGGALYLASDLKPVITGGTFNIDPSACVAEDYEAVNNGDGTWTVRSATPHADVKVDENGDVTATIDNGYFTTDASESVTIAPASGSEVSVTFNEAAVQAIAEAADTYGLLLKVDDTTAGGETDTKTFEITMVKTANGQATTEQVFTSSSAGAKATVTVPFAVGEGKVPQVNLVVDGTKTPVAVTGWTATTVTFDVVHFSEYEVSAAEAVAQIGTTNYATLEAAFAAAQDGDEIVMIADSEENVLYDVTSPNLKNKTVTISGEQKLTSPSGNFGFYFGDYDSGNRPATDTLNVSGVTMEKTGGNYTALFDGVTADLTNVTINSDGNTGLSYANGAVGTLTDVTVSNTGSHSQSWRNTALALQGIGAGPSVVTVKSGSYTSTNGYAVYMFSSGGTVNIKGGTFSGALMAQIDNKTYPGNQAIINISGGTFTNCTLTESGGENAQINVSGGYFNVNPTAYLLPGYTVVTLTSSATGDDLTAYNAGAIYKVVEAVTVTYKKDAGDTEAYATQIIAKGSTATAPATNPTKENSIFGGWTLNGTDYDFDTPVTADITLTAKWTAAVASITVGGNTTYFATLAAAITAAQDGETITLLKDISLSERLFVNAGATPSYAGSGNRYATTSENKTIILDLNGHNIESDSNIALAGGSLNITGNGTISTRNTGLAPIKVRGTGDLATKRTLTIGQNVTLTGAEYGLNVFGSNDAQKNLIDVTVNGTVNGMLYVLGNLTNENNSIDIIVNGTVDASNAQGQEAVHTGIALNGNADLIVNDGATVKGESGIEVRAGVLHVNGGTIEATANAYSYEANGSGTTTKGAAIAVAQHNTNLPVETVLVREGITLDGPKSIAVTDVNNDMSKVTVWAKEQSYTQNSVIPQNCVWYNDVEKGYYTLVVQVTVTFDANGGTGTMDPQVFRSGTTNKLSANSFTGPDATSWPGEQKVFVEWNTKPDGTGTSYADRAEVTLTRDLTLYAQWKEPIPVAEVVRDGSVIDQYATLQKAFNAAAGGDTVRLLENVTHTETTTLSGKSVTLDLDSKTVTMDGDTPAFTVGTSGKLTVTGSGTVDAGSNCFTVNGSSSSLTIENGTYISHSGYNIAVYQPNQNSKINVLINNGEFKGTETSVYVKDLKAYSVQFRVNNGRFAGKFVEDTSQWSASGSQSTGSAFYGGHYNYPDTLDTAGLVGGIYSDAARNSIDFHWKGDYVVWGGNPDSATIAAYPNKLTRNVVVTFDPNAPEGEVQGTMSRQSIAPNTSTALWANTYTRVGYAFRGWNTKEDGNGTHYDDKATISFPENTNVTLYAEWELAVAQVGNHYYETLLEALKHASSYGGTIKLLQDVTQSTTLEVREYVTTDIELDLNGHTITGPDNDYLFLTAKYADQSHSENTFHYSHTLTIRDSSAGKTGEIRAAKLFDVPSGTIEIAGGHITGAGSDGTYGEIKVRGMNKGNAAFKFVGTVNISGGAVNATGIVDTSEHPDNMTPAIRVYKRTNVNAPVFNTDLDKYVIPSQVWVENTNEATKTNFPHTVEPAVKVTFRIQNIGKFSDNTTADKISYIRSGATVTAQTVSAEGYHFDGWYAENASTAFNFNDPITADVTLLASFSKYVAQIGTTKYTSLQAAFDEATNGNTIELLDSFTQTGTATLSGKSVTLDLSGKTITYSGGANSGAVQVESGATLTVVSTAANGKITGTGTNSNAISNSGTLVVGTENGENFTLEGKNVGVYSYSGSVTVNGGTIGNTTNSGGIFVTNGSFTLNGGTINSKKDGITVYGGTIEIKGGTINCTAGSSTSYPNAALWVAGSNAKVTINGGTFDGGDTNSKKASINLTEGRIDVGGGQFKGNLRMTSESGASYELYGGIYSTTAKQNIASNHLDWIRTGLSFAHNEDQSTKDKYPWMLHAPVTVHFNSNGGSGEMTSQQVGYGVDTVLNPNTYSHSQKVFGGWNTVQNPTTETPGTSYANGDIINTTAEETTLYAQWVDAVARVNNYNESASFYSTLQDAVNAVTNGGEVWLLTNITVSQPVKVTKAYFTLYLGEYTVTGTMTNGYLLEVGNDSTEGKFVIVNNKSSSSGGRIVSSAGVIQINKGYVDVNGGFLDGYETNGVYSGADKTSFDVGSSGDLTISPFWDSEHSRYAVALQGEIAKAGDGDNVRIVDGYFNPAPENAYIYPTGKAANNG